MSLPARSRVVLLVIAAAVMSCSEQPVLPQPGTCGGCAPQPGTPAELHAYLDHALDIMQSSSISRAYIDWPVFRADAHRQVVAATTITEMRGGVVYALQRLGDRHSFLLAPGANDRQANTLESTAASRTPIALGSIVAGRLGWIQVPSLVAVGDSAVAAADQVQEVVAALDRSDPCGWIVDLRGVLAGEMWPALAGLAPVLGSGTLGAFINAYGVRSSWLATTGSVGTRDAGGVLNIRGRVTQPYSLRRAMPPVAVVLGSATQGAGEGIAAAFSGRAMTRSFGLSTYGVPTTDLAYPLRDGSIMYLTVAVDEDRTGRVFWPSAITPDEVQSSATYYPQSSDDAALAARNWLLTTAACK